MNILEENISGKFHDMGLSNLGAGILTPKAKSGKAKINQWCYIKLKIFCTAKETIDEMKRQPFEQEQINIFKEKNNKGLIFEICKELIQLNGKNII